MRRILQILLITVIAAAGAHSGAAEKSFDGISCQSDIAKALVGRHMPNGRSVDTEAKYAKLQLKNLGGFGGPDEPYILGNWLICGTEYLVLEHPTTSIVSDVLKSPVAYAAASSAITICTGERGREWSIAIAFPPKSMGRPPWLLPEIWEIGETTLKFRRIADGPFRCR